SLRRDRVAQMMVFVLPISFFSIFAMVFGGRSMSSMPRVPVVVVDEDHSETSRQLVRALRADPALDARDSVRAGLSDHDRTLPPDRAMARDRVRSGDFPVALVIPAGWGATFPSFTVSDVLGDHRQSGRMISFYAAGVAVMFLLFSASSGGGALLDEQDSGTLERVLNSNVGMGGLLAGKWLHLVILGLTQITVMF